MMFHVLQESIMQKMKQWRDTTPTATKTRRVGGTSETSSTDPVGQLTTLTQNNQRTGN